MSNDIKNTKSVTYDPSFTHKGNPGGKADHVSRLLAYGFLLPPNILKTCKSNNERDITQKHKICDFMNPV